MKLDQLHAIAAAAREVRPLPTTCARIVTLMNQDQPEAKALADLIELDPGLTLRVLRSANSAIHAPSQRISDVQSAVVRIGVGWVLSLAVGPIAGEMLNKPMPQYGLEQGELWHESIRAALCSQVLARLTRLPNPREAHTAALLHNIGKSILADHLRPNDLRAIRLAEGIGISRAAAERDILGLSYADVGGFITDLWTLPPQLSQAVSFHGTPPPQAVPVVDIVHIGSLVAQAPHNPNWYELVDAPCLERWSIGPQTLKEVAQTVEGDFGEAASALSAT